MRIIEIIVESSDEYLWHGSKNRNEVLVPRQARDTGGAESSNKNAVYATPIEDVAIAMGMTTPGSETGMFPDDPQMVLFKGKIRKGEMVYLHKVPKDLFIKHNSREYYSKPDVKEITPIEIKEVPVDDHLDLIRTVTPQDLELQKKYMKPEGKKITLSTDPNWYGAEVGDYKATGPVVNIPANKLVGFEPDDKMNQSKSKANVEKIVAGLKKGDKLPPLLVRKYKNGYQVLDGHHRFWAYKLIGVNSIPAQVVPEKDIEVKTEATGDEKFDKMMSKIHQDIDNQKAVIDKVGNMVPHEGDPIVDADTPRMYTTGWQYYRQYHHTRGIVDAVKNALNIPKKIPVYFDDNDLVFVDKTVSNLKDTIRRMIKNTQTFMEENPDYVEEVYREYGLDKDSK